MPKKGKSKRNQIVLVKRKRRPNWRISQILVLTKKSSKNKYLKRLKELKHLLKAKRLLKPIGLFCLMVVLVVVGSLVYQNFEKITAATYTWTVPTDTDWDDAAATLSNAEKSGTDLVMTNKDTQLTQTDWDGSSGVTDWDESEGATYDDYVDVDDSDLITADTNQITLGMTTESYTEDFNDEAKLDRTNTTGNWRMKSQKAVAGFTDTITLKGTWSHEVESLNYGYMAKNLYGDYVLYKYNSNYAIDISTPTSPTKYCTTSHAMVNAVISGDLMFVVTNNDLGSCDLSGLNPDTCYSCDWSVSGFAEKDIDVQGSCLYVAENNAGSGVKSFTATDPPSFVDEEPLGVACEYIDVQGDYAYVGCDDDIKMVDISGPGCALDSVAVGGDDANDIQGLRVQGDYLYIADEGGDLKVFNISNPAAISLVGSGDTANNAKEIDVDGRYTYVGLAYAHVEVWDVINPGSPTKLGTATLSYSYNPHVVIEDNYLYTSSYNHHVDQGLDVTQMTYRESSDIVSLGVDDVSGNIYSATLTGTATTPGGTGVSYEMSADGGSNWEPVTSGVEYVFLNAGSDLRWKATLTGTTTATAELTGISIDYTEGYDTSSSHYLTSSAYDFGTANTEWGIVDWNESGTQTVNVKIRTSNDDEMVGATAWGSVDNATDGADISSLTGVTDGHRYIQYRAYLSTNNAAQTPTFQDITINTLVYGTDTIVHDASGDAGWVENDWTITSEPANTDIKFRFATSDDNAVWSAWSSYSTADPIDLTSTGLNLADSRYLKVEARLETQSDDTGPALDDFVITYSQNGPPEVQNVTASQDSTGTVNIGYEVRDTDSTSGTVNPGQATISFQYYDGDSWEECTTTTGEGLQDVEEVSYTSYTGTWTPTTDFDNQYYASTVQIRVTANDNELLYSSVTADSSAFELDTKDPVPGATPISINSAATKTNSTSVTLTLAASDDTSLTQNYSNDGTTYGTVTDSDGSVTDSGTYESYRTSKSWTMTAGDDGERTVYVIYKDAKGNTSTAQSDSITYDSTAADIPSNLTLDDASDIGIERYSLILQWDPISESDNADFDHYQLEYSTNATDYSTEVTFNDITTGYYLDTGLSADNTYYYRIKSVDNIENESDPSTVVNMQPASEDITAPDLSGEVPASACTQTTCTVAWTTDESATSCVEYGASTDYGEIECELNFVLEHEVAIAGLTANTTYHYRVISKDASGNQATGADYTMTTQTSTDDLTPPDLSGEGPQVIPGSDSALVTWITNEAADSFVEYGETTDYGTLQGDVTMVTNHSVTITGLTPLNVYHFRVRSKDAAANETISQDYSFITTTPVGSDIPPEISTVATQAPGTSDTSIIISWSTDTYSTSQVLYGLSSNNLDQETEVDPILNKTHYVTISGLQPSTTYYYKVKSVDVYDNVSISEVKNFTTASSPTAPEIDNTSLSVVVKDTTATITWKTDQASSSIVEYGTTTDYGTEVGDTDEQVTTHTVEVIGLSPDTTYHYRVKSDDGLGNTGYSSDNTFSTLASPSISEVVVSDITLSSAIISWKTNTVATSIVNYGSSATNLTNQIIDQSLSYTTNHVIRMTNLSSGTDYYFQVSGTDANGKTLSSDTYKFATIALPSISGVSVTEITADTAKINYRTNVPTDTLVALGEDTNYPTTQGTSDLVTEHEVVLIGLKPSTFYYFQVRARDQYGNQATSSDRTLTTLADLVPPIIDKVGSETAVIGSGEESQVQAIFSWTTDEPATSQVFYNQGVSRLTGGQVNTFEAKTPEDDNFTRNHVVILSNMEPSQTYQYLVSSKDESGNVAYSDNLSMLTPQARRSILQIVLETLENTFSWVGRIREFLGGE